jgi:hypothetical protein
LTGLNRPVNSQIVRRRPEKFGNKARSRRDNSPGTAECTGSDEAVE